MRRQALDLADRLVRDFPDSPEALYARGLLLSSYGNTAEAVRCWEACLRKAPKFAHAYDCLGTAALRRGDNRLAASWFRKALALDSQLPGTALRLAEALMNMGKMEEAIPVLEEYARNWPRSTEALFRLGQAHLHLKNYQSAINYHQAALKVDPKCIPSHWGLVTACERLGQTAKADQYRAKLQELYKSDYPVQTARRRQYDDESKLRRELAEAYMIGAEVYRANGKLQQAEECWRQAAAADPTHGPSRKSLAAALVQQGRLAEAVRLLEQLQKIEPEEVAHCVNLGTLYGRLGQFDAAEATLLKGLKLAPTRGEPYAALARFYLDQNRKLPDALRLAREAVRLQPSGAHYLMLAVACERSGDRQEALAAIRQAMQVEPTNPAYLEALHHLHTGSQPSDRPQ
ncbi:MAG: tetratricopeptide repeat protein [Thermoguttaceae bacterium]